MLLWFVAGVVVGWLIELLIDWLFWRRTILRPVQPDSSTLHELATLRQKVQEYEAYIQILERQTVTK